MRLATHLSKAKRIKKWLTSIYAVMGAYAFRLTKTEMPGSGTYPWIADPGVWMDEPGPLIHIRDDLLELVKQVRNDDAMQVEAEYAAKWRPRNVKLGDAVERVINDLRRELIVPTPSNNLHWEFNVPNVVKILRAIGLGRSRGETPVWSIKPNKSQAAVGMTYDVTKGHFFRGHKGDCWQRILLAAKRYKLKAHEDDRLRWDKMDDVKYRILREYALAFIPLLRIDSKPLDPRIIFGGSSIMMAVEQSLLGNLMNDLKKIDYFAYTARSTMKRIAKMGDAGVERFLMGDLSHWDRSLCSKFITDVWHAIQIVYDLPEDEMVLCAIYNAYAPLILPDHGELRVRSRDGIQPSGSGGFVPVNHLLNFCFQILLTMHFYKENDDNIEFENALEKALQVGGQVYGDDFFWPDIAGSSVWSQLLKDAFGIVMKASQTLVSDKIVVMTSRIYHLDTGLAEPIIMRRGRNALCPTVDPMPYVDKEGNRLPDESLHFKIKTAISYRAQSEEIQFLAQQGVKGYQAIWDFWKVNVCPEEFTMPDKTMADLSRLADAYHVSRDALTYMKSYEVETE